MSRSSLQVQAIEAACRPTLILGGTGQLGRSWLAQNPGIGPIVAPTRHQLDLRDADAIEAYIQQLAPGLILNGSAYNGVDQAEIEPDLADALNHRAPAAMARAAQSVGAAIVHISTNYVFDRHQGPALVETDGVAPRSVYARSKYAGEQAVQRFCDRHVIVRSAWLYSGEGGFVRRMLDLGQERLELRIVQDQWGTPTAAVDLAAMTWHLADRLIADPGLAGLYHYSHSGETTWYDFAVAIFEQARLAGLPLKLQRLIPIQSADYPTPAHRPAYAVLNLDRARSALGESPDWPPHWQDRLTQLMPTFIPAICR
jgi:dTDP-4-dehydrorhamnose reductase